ncbi:MAG: hypothetical protein Q4A66_11165, partial [Eubacteriales bacterium]|nr:hypothetical protein [Eubacteriales bacterium]
MAGETAQLRLAHESYGTMLLSVALRSLDVFGQESIEALPGASVQLYRVTESGMEDTGLTLSCGEDGVIAVQL